MRRSRSYRLGDNLGAHALFARGIRGWQPEIKPQQETATMKKTPRLGDKVEVQRSSEPFEWIPCVVDYIDGATGFGAAGEGGYRTYRYTAGNRWRWPKSLQIVSEQTKGES